MKRLRLPISTVDFPSMAGECDIFVDKSLFIQEILDSSYTSLLITRPRRWGKTLNLDMLKTFLSVAVDAEGNIISPSPFQPLFTGGDWVTSTGTHRQLEPLAIAKVENGTYLQHQGKFPVISLSLKDVKGHSLEVIHAQLAQVIKNLFWEHAYLLQSTSLKPGQAELFQNLIGENPSTAAIQFSLKFLSLLLYQHHHRKVFILIDEYDKPVNYLLEQSLEGKGHPLLNTLAEFISSLISSVGKNNPYREKLVLTGIFDTLLKRGSSAINDVASYGVADTQFHKNFAFSEAEITELVIKLGFDSVTGATIQQNIKAWYNGYSLPGNATTLFYTPWAVMRYLGAAYSDDDLRPANYWPSSGTSSILENLFDYLNSKELREKFQSLAQGGEQILQYNKHSDVLELGYHSSTEEIFAYVLLHSGYLTARQESGVFYFRVPNFEVSQEFTRIIHNELERLELQPRAPDTPNLLYEKLLRNSLDGLLKNPLKEAVSAIIANDAVALKEVLHKNPGLTCFSKQMEIGLLHIAAAMGDAQLLSTVVSHCETVDLLTPDRFAGLRPQDYAYLSGDAATLSILQQGDKDTLSLRVPSLLESLLCYPFGAFYVFYNLCTVSALTAGIKLVNKLFTPKDMGTMSLFGALALTDIALNVAEESAKTMGKGKFGTCDAYDAYAAVSATELGNLNAFEKYRLLHIGAYIKVNQECANGDQTIASTLLQIFNYDEEWNLQFMLCEHLH